MNAIIDTSSLLALVKYYLPFDRSNKFKDFIKKGFEDGEFLIIDRVASEAKYIAKGVILRDLDFITTESKLILNTNEILPNKKFFNRLGNDFCNQSLRELRGVNHAEFENHKRSFLESADAKIILSALALNNPDVIIVTEESKSENDQKLFKKIPNICLLIGVQCCSLPTFFKDHCCISLDEYLN